jgi:predicted RNA-binding Zn-ribbon protein involved in translation (DUF1610 family)
VYAPIAEKVGEGVKSYACPKCGEISKLHDWNYTTNDFFNDGEIVEIDRFDAAKCDFVCPKCNEISVYEDIVNASAEAMNQLEAKAQELDRREKGVTVVDSERTWDCGYCGEHVITDEQYCSACGTRLIWESEAGDDN